MKDLEVINSDTLVFGVLRNIILIILFITQITACSPRDKILEEKFLIKLQRFTNSNAPSMSLNEVLGNNWRKICVQSPYTIKEDFNKNSGENIGNLLDISENEIAFWVFYNDGTIGGVILEKVKIDIGYFGAPISKNGNPIICTTARNPYIYINRKTSLTVMHFKDY